MWEKIYNKNQRIRKIINNQKRLISLENTSTIINMKTKSNRQLLYYIKYRKKHMEKQIKKQLEILKLKAIYNNLINQTNIINKTYQKVSRLKRKQ